MKKYLIPALLTGLRVPLLGHVPVNLAAMGAFAALGFSDPVFWVAGGTWQTVWLAFTAGRPGYRRGIDAKARLQAWREIEAKRLTLYNALPSAPRGRHHRLRERCRPLLSPASGSTPDAGAELFLWLHLKLLLARESVHSAAGAPPADGDHLHRLSASASVDLTDPAAAALASHAVSLLGSRASLQEDAARRLEQIDSQLARIEGELESAVTRHGLRDAPHDFQHSASLAADLLRDPLEDRPLAGEVDRLFERVRE